MKRVSFPLIFCLPLLLLFSCYRDQDAVLTQQLEKLPPIQKQANYFVAVPINKFSSIQSPCLDVQIDDVKMSMELDLGFRGDMTISEKWIDQITRKTFLGTKSMYGIRGKEYPKTLYKIPKVKIGDMVFSKLILQEDTDEFLNDSVFVQDGKIPSPKEPGRLGWNLFHNSNLLIDVQNLRIAFCDSIDTLQNQGYRIEDFVKTSLLTERGLIEFNVETLQGPLRCMLDTGATWNLLNSELEDDQSIEQAMWESENEFEYSSFRISNQDFGPITFHCIPIKIPIKIDAILGMEFFENHLVFIDFTKNNIYFAKYELGL